MLFLSAALWSQSLAVASDRPSPRLVVILYPQNDDGSPGNALFDQGLRSTFENSTGEPIELYAEFLDLARPHSSEDRRLHLDYLRRKYAGRRADLIIAALSPALDFALEYRAELFPGAPVVYCAVDQREANARKLPPDVVGVPIAMELAPTLDLGLRLHPDTQRVYVVAGKSAFDTDWVAEARQEFRPYEKRVEFVYLTGEPLDDLIRHVADLPPHSLIYYLHVFQDGKSQALVPPRVLELIARATNAPIYGHVDAYVGRGIVGGRVFGVEAAGRDAARVALRVLNGEDPQKIVIRNSQDNAYMFDWNQLQRWGISESSLPPGSIVRHRKTSFWAQYKWPIIVVMTICVVQALLIVGLLVQRSSRRRAESALQASERRYRTLFEKANDAIFLETEDDAIVGVNHRACELLGYSRDELLAKKVPDLQAPEVRGQLGTVIKGELANHSDRLFEAQDVHRDGRRIPVEVTDAVIEEDGKRMVLSIVRDITDRKQAEKALLESQTELRLLTGRLLRAQEAERRHIARELHDDLNQDLALLAVELDLLSQRPAESPARFAEVAREMSARVKQLSSTVHDLSHQLHPSKLEQLGLVAAVRSLCRELTVSHSLPIEFTHTGVPKTIPEDTALCLYRIVQEALRNTIKHSIARHAGVELHGRSAAITLSIVDDGTGFDPGLADGNGLGLVSMRERLHLVQGTITIDSRPSGGTRIDVRVPVATNGKAVNGAPPPQHRNGDSGTLLVSERRP
jgi:PAS domain S-box-containing protein